MEWKADVLWIDGQPTGSIRQMGERWIAFLHRRDGASVLGYYNTRAEAADRVEAMADARRALAVVA